MNEPLATAAQVLREARCAVAVTGAGISVESGIPTFRGAGGIWQKYPPEIYANIDAYRRDPDTIWQFWGELAELVRGCKPNPAHIALAELEQHGRLQAVVTQNVDNLHQVAGSRHVIEYHGNAGRLICMECRHNRPNDALDLKSGAPHCEQCGALMKPDVVMFGEEIPKRALIEAHLLAEKCDVMIVVGTSAQVYPAADLPYTAKNDGAFIIELNTEKTDFTDTVSNVFLQGPAGITLPQLLQAALAGAQ